MSKKSWLRPLDTIRCIPEASVNPYILSMLLSQESQELNRLDLDPARRECAIGFLSASAPVQRSWLVQCCCNTEGVRNLQLQIITSPGWERSTAVSRSVLPCQHVQDAVDRAGLDATLVREFCTLGAMVLVPWQHWKRQHENVKILYDSLRIVFEISMISRLGLDMTG